MPAMLLVLWALVWIAVWIQGRTLVPRFERHVFRVRAIPSWGRCIYYSVRLLDIWLASEETVQNNPMLSHRGGKAKILEHFGRSDYLQASGLLILLSLTLVFPVFLVF